MESKTEGTMCKSIKNCQKQVSKVTLHFVWGQLLRKQTVCSLGQLSLSIFILAVQFKKPKSNQIALEKIAFAVILSNISLTCCVLSSAREGGKRLPFLEPLL